MAGFDEKYNEPFERGLTDEMKSQMLGTFTKMIANIRTDELVVALTNDGLFIYDAIDKKLKSTDGKIIIDVHDKILYTWIGYTYVACIMVFKNIDALLDYINKNIYKEDYKNYIEHVITTNNKMF